MAVNVERISLSALSSDQALYAVMTPQRHGTSNIHFKVIFVRVIVTRLRSDNDYLRDSYLAPCSLDRRPEERHRGTYNGKIDLKIGEYENLHNVSS